MEFKLPDPGEGIHEAEVVEVLVAEGDTVEEGQVVVVVETDKASNEIPAPASGTVRSLAVSEGDFLEVGDVLLVLDVEGEEEDEAGDADDDAEAGEEQESDRGEAAKEDAEADAAQEEDADADDADEAEEEEAESDEAPPDEAEGDAAGEREAEGASGEEEASEREGDGRKKPPSDRPVPARPSTRRLARERGVDLHAIRPSGPGGRVTDEDVLAAAEGEQAEAAPRGRKERQKPRARRAPSPPDFERWGEVERRPLRSVRGTIARRMARAWEEIPHVSHQDVADITELERWRQDEKERIAKEGGHLTLTVIALKAAVAALRQHPRFNASLDVEANEIVLKRYYHVGVAVDTERGLLVPVVRDVDRKSMAELALEVPELARRAREGDLGREELDGGSFTVTNVGPLGGTGFSPIVNHPQVAILGLSRARLENVVTGSLDAPESAVRLVLPVSLAFDHRVVDGADAARFTRDVVAALEDPRRLLVEM